MTELGVYILGATALAILAAAGIASGNNVAVACAVGAAGAAYLAQLGAFGTVNSGPPWSMALNAVGMGIALVLWAVGAFTLI